MLLDRACERTIQPSLREEPNSVEASEFAEWARVLAIAKVNAKHGNAYMLHILYSILSFSTPKPLSRPRYL